MAVDHIAVNSVPGHQIGLENATLSLVKLAKPLASTYNLTQFNSMFILVTAQGHCK